MYRYLFGPVPSRRLGVSLGVDLVTHKICSLDCVYCECGNTTELTLERKEYVPYKEVIDELKHYFSNHPAPDYITFSGSGEPTLNSRIGDVIEYIKVGAECKTATENSSDKSTKVYEDGQPRISAGAPGVSVAVLTNGTLLGDRAVREALLKADLVMPSLDAASLSAFEKINRPHKGINLDSYIEGLVDFRKVYTGKIALEILILPGFNDSRADLELLKQACYRINPDVIQLNTLDRPGALTDLTPAPHETLEKIKEFLQTDSENRLPYGRELNQMESCSGKTLNQLEITPGNDMIRSIEVEIIASAPKRQENRAYRKDMESAILETVHRRPCTLEDLASILGSHINEINKYLSALELNGQILSVPQPRGIFYHSVKR